VCDPGGLRRERNRDRDGDGGGGGTPTRTPTDAPTRTPAPTTTARQDGTVVVTVDGFWPFHEREERLNRWLREAGLPADVRVAVDVSFLTEDRMSRYTQLLRAGESDPALLSMRAAWLPFFYEADLLADVEARLPGRAVRRVREAHHSSMRALATAHGGRIHAVPYRADVALVFYRRDLLVEAGHDPSGWATAPPDWETFARAVADAREAAGVPGGLTLQAARYEGLSCCTFLEAFRSWGGGYFGAPAAEEFGPLAGREVTVDGEAGRRALRMLRGFLGTGEGLVGSPTVVPAAALEWTEEPSREPFFAGEAVAHRNWPYALRMHATETPVPGTLGAAPLPRGVAPDAGAAGAGGSVPTLNGDLFALNPHAPGRTQEAAAAVLAATCTETFRLRALRDPTARLMPPAPSVLDGDGATDVPGVGDHLDAYRRSYERARVAPYFPAWDRGSSTIAREVHRSLAGEATPGEALSSLATRLRSLGDDDPA
jgi:ABC-type glycerol-3-phosphate transport system substrate-binding protein